MTAHPAGSGWGGYFQRTEYYLPFRDRIRRWFTPDRGPAIVTPEANDVLVSIRRGIDYKAKGWILPLGYYGEALATMPDLDRVYIAGTGIDDDVRDFFADYGPVYLEGSPVDHLRDFPRFSRFILSNSTFSWWTAFLSTAADIVGPETDPGSGIFSFHGFTGVDLRIPSSCYRSITVSHRGETPV